MIENSGIRVTFDAFRDTKTAERFLLNTAQFSAAKSAAEAKMMQTQLFDQDGKLKGFDRYSKDVQSVIDVQQQTWLRVEYETCRRETIAGDKFQRMRDDSDLYPYWVYRGVMDSRERPEHVELEGRVFQIGDPDSDACFPPNDWNCRCKGDPVDGRYLDQNKVSPTGPGEAKALLSKYVDPQFQYNPANGPMPDDHSYFQTFPNANSGNAGLFGAPPPDEDGRELTGLAAAKGMTHFVNVISRWQRDYHVDNRHNLVFQNKKTLTNVRLSTGILHEISKHSRGFQNIPQAIISPTEIWSKWEDPGEQRRVLRAYILMGRISYVVMTLDGQVLDAFAVPNKAINKYRTGVILL